MSDPEDKYQHHKADYVGMPHDELVYVLVASREKFDAIRLPETAHENGCRSKSIGDFSTAMVIFQWWPPAGAQRPSQEAS